MSSSISISSRKDVRDSDSANSPTRPSVLDVDDPSGKGDDDP
jgi:hypothetical protein